MAERTAEVLVDRGGTFTDIVALLPDGSIDTEKLLSHSSEYADAAVEGVRRVVNRHGISMAETRSVKMGTTVATNALLERAGERTLLLTNTGLADALAIGYQARPRLFDLRITPPSLLHERVYELSCRIDCNGDEIAPLDEADARAKLEDALQAGIKSVAIVLMHSYTNGAHERRLARIASEVGFEQVSASHECSELIKLIGRGDTAVVDAYLSPILRRYVNHIAKELGDGVDLQFMQSSGGLTSAKKFRGKDAILSGPAGGIVGSARTAEAGGGGSKLITFDMGGTSTDVAHYAGGLERAFETHAAGVRVRAPMMQIHTVAAGGGSVCSFDGSRFRVGPKSAGASPGPASYGNGGPATVTDCNVLLGRVQPDFFPKLFGPNHDQPLNAIAAAKRFEEIANDIFSQSSQRINVEEAASGFLKIAVENMANAIKKISVQRGYDVTQYTLVSFGGAGGQHACQVADALGIRKVFIHPLAGVLSAYGMGLADISAIRQSTVEKDLTADALTGIEQALQRLGNAAYEEVASQNVPANDIVLDRRTHLRYKGTDTPLPVIFRRSDLTSMRSEFENTYKERFGFMMPDKDVVVESAVVEAIGRTASAAKDIPGADHAQNAPAPRAQVNTYFDGQWTMAPLYRRHDFATGANVTGPAIIAEETSTTVVEPNWKAKLSSKGMLIEKISDADDATLTLTTKRDPVYLEVFNNLFMSIAEQMGYTLQNTSSSVNMKERLDFSCAIFDASGHLIANAPHVPVHLGSMGESVRSVIQRNQSTMSPGDVYVLNDPYNGGTHLPDVTAITPVFDEEETQIIFYVGSRGHQADIGGKTPASMPSDSTHIDEEGVLIDNFKLVDRGEFKEEAFRNLLLSAPYAARNPELNLADIRAQIAANNKGIRELRKIMAQFGKQVVQAYMTHVQNNAEEAVRRAVGALTDGEFECFTDQEAKVHVRVDVDHDKGSAKIDFSGTSAQRPDNFNAPRAICQAACLYVFRTLVADEIPLNEGCMKALQISIPEGTMLNPKHPAAVVAGNVETSQLVVDTLYGALGIMAAAQGTMNNVTFGSSSVQYYETVGGGSGAGDGFEGADAVHTHMTNSRLTDPEVLEHRYPVMLEKFAIRRGSGGWGKYFGGNGIDRRIKFHEPMSVSILANRRKVPPYGMAGGGTGAVGKTWVVRASDGTEDTMSSCDKRNVDAGDIFVLQTPGGGGYGTPNR